MQDFVHLHVHTHYSMLDGACKIPALVKRAKALGMSSLAISDHGSLFGIVEFFSECKKEGIKPIIGLEAYMAPGDRRERTTPSGSAGDAAYHLLLLATDLQGYQNLLRLGSIAYREGFYYKPRIDKAVLKEFSQGLVATSACLGGEVANAFLKRDTKNAKAIAEQYLEIFGPDRFFIEVQKQGIKEQDMVNPELAGLADRLGCGIVGTNDVHFLTAEDHYAHDVLCCISMGKLITDENRLKYPTQLYLKSAEEMHQALSEYPQAISNTLRIAEMCNLDLDFSKRHAPVYRVPQEKLAAEMPPLPEGRDTCADDERYLRQLCEEGLVWRYGTTDVDADVRARLAKELNVIVSKNFCSYFLIVWDFCNYARDNGIPVGARGSGVGTMVGYLLGLCNVDPVKYGLLFERFMDPSRNEMPDIDIDICQDGRPRVIDYVRKKYGHVAQIITFGTLAAKAACKDVGRVMGVPLQDIDRLTKLIPGIPGMTLDKALASVPDLSQLYKDDGRIKQVIDIAKRLEGLCRNAGCHAAGVVIADQPLDNFVPLYVDKDDNVLTQFEGPVVEKVGLLKMDFLGLRTLSVLQRSIHLVKEVKGVDIDIEKIDLTDRSVLALFCRGESRGIFQFESGGMQDLLMKMQPDRIEDLIAANALYRPGPMELIPLYCNRKHGREQVPSVHPAMDAILAETYGIMVYQEQVMQIFNQLGGIELSSAYKLIKAISKKLSDVIAKFKPEFLKGAMERGITKAAAEELFDLILKFGGYGFNKSHSTRYAIVAFQTAYMKVYHPIEYMAALLTYESGSTEKVVEYIDECRKMTLLDGSRGIQVLPPDINISRVDFTPVYEKKNPNAPKSKRKAAPAAPSGVIRFGLGAVKGVGTKAVEQIMAERDKNGPFTSLFDFCERVDLRAVNRSTLDALIKCGAFDNLGGHRAQLLTVLDRAIEMGQQTQADKRSGQGALFGGNTEETTGTALAKPSIPLPDVEQFPSADLLKQEKEVLGFYITSHPLAEHQMTLAHLGTDSTRSAGSRSEGSDVCIGAMISEVRSRIAKSGRSAGQRWAIVKFEDLEGSIEGMVFAEKFGELMSRDARLLATESIIFVRGKVDRKRENPCLVVNDIFSVDEGPGRLTTGLLLKIDRDRHKPDVMSEIKPLLTRHKGPTPVFLQVSVDDNSRTAMLRLNSEASIKPSRDLKEDLEMLLGSGAVQLCGPGTKRQQKQQRQEKLFAGATEPATPAPTFADQEALQIESLDAEMAEA